MSTVISRATQQQGIGGLFLPAHLVGYIGSFIRTNFDSNLLLNMYKAFESITYEGDEDPLGYYKAEVQAYIAYLAEDGVILDERDAGYELTQREMMYIFDCYYCDPSVIMYGEETYEDLGDICIVNTAHMQHIDHEFLDCSEFTETLALPYMGIQFGLSDELNIKMYKYIRLLEEALRLKSTGLIAYMKDKMVISPDMLLYIYIKHNHQVYAPDWYSLAADDLLLTLLKEAGVLPAVLGLAIGGKYCHYAGSEAALKNVVNPNREVVKKIVPAHISPSSAMIPYEDYYDEYEAQQRFFESVTPYEYWETTYNGEIARYQLGEEIKIIKVVGSKEIGEYLKSLE
jgi:hypothetical protein